MKNLLLLLIAFLLLGGGTYWLLQKNKTEGNSSILPAERDFAVKNVDDIGKIFIADHSNNKTLLERRGNSDEWTYNGQYKARPNAMENLLRAIKELEMRYQPANAAKENIIKSIASRGIKVEIYDKKGEKMKSYYIGGAPNSELGTYAIIDGFEQPYVVHIPTFSGNVRFRYNLTGDDWKDRHPFEVPLEKIQEVSVEYPRQKNKSYRIIKKAKGFDVSPFYDQTPGHSGKPNQSAIERYLTKFEKKQFMGFENAYDQKEAVEKETPFCNIHLKTTDDKEYTLTVWPQRNAPKADTQAAPKPGEVNTSRYFALMNGKDFISLSHNVMADIFGDYNNFFK